jgi:hypothetical protein
VITDAHTHLYDASHASPGFVAGLRGKWDTDEVFEAPPAVHAEAMKDVDRVIVLALEA